jgi:hypothetical protein
MSSVSEHSGCCRVQYLLYIFRSFVPPELPATGHRHVGILGEVGSMKKEAPGFLFQFPIDLGAQPSRMHNEFLL